MKVNKKELIAHFAKFDKWTKNRPYITYEEREKLRINKIISDRNKIINELLNE
jgi:hypothetical protein